MQLFPLHEVRNINKYNDIVLSMKKNGWKGRNIIVLNMGDYLQAITGSHRIPAAQELDIDIPLHIIDTTDHIVDDNGECIVCQGECCVIRLIDGDDFDRLEILEKIGDAEGAKIMKEEIKGNIK